MWLNSVCSFRRPSRCHTAAWHFGKLKKLRLIGSALRYRCDPVGRIPSRHAPQNFAIARRGIKTAPGSGRLNDLANAFELQHRFQAQAAHFRFSPDSRRIAASHRSPTKSADARRGAVHGVELRQAAGLLHGPPPIRREVRLQSHISRQSAQPAQF
jgi:hypothetical protein